MSSVACKAGAPVMGTQALAAEMHFRCLMLQVRMNSPPGGSIVILRNGPQDPQSSKSWGPHVLLEMGSTEDGKIGEPYQRG